MSVTDPGPSSSKELFRRVALLISRPAYWTVSPAYQTALRHTSAVGRLLRWALSLPGASLGIDPKGIGLLLRSVYRLRREVPTDEMDKLLDGLGATESETVLYRDDLEVFGPETDHLLSFLKQARQGEYVWVTGKDAQWWVEKTEQSFQNYARQCGGDESALLRLFIRHRCVVFAPFDAESISQSLLDLLISRVREEVGGDSAQRMQGMLQYHALTEPIQTPYALYWSWRLVDFSVSKNDLIYQPMLALWNSWPASRRWAPAPSDEQPTNVLLTPEEAASLLEDVLWKKVETLFAIVRQSLGLGVAEPEFAGKEVQSPVFYFATPAELPPSADEYERGYRSSLYTLTRTCLRSDDPFSHEVAWGAVEGNLLALRCERPSQRQVAAWYLLLPFSPTPTSEEEFEQDLDFVADKMTFLEFSIGHEARDVDTDVREYATRYARWGGSLDGVSEQVGQSPGFLQRARPAGRGKVGEEMTRLSLLLFQMRALLEKTNSDAQQVVRKFQGYLDGTEDFFRRAFTYAPLPGRHSLQEAVLDAYPYHYLQQPVRSLENMMETVTENLRGFIEVIERGIESVERSVERSVREAQARWMRMLGVLFGLLTLLVALPQFVPGAVLTAETYPAWLQERLPLPVLEVLVRGSVGMLILSLVIVVFGYAFYQIYHYFGRSEDPNIDRIRHLWDLVEQSHDLVLKARSLLLEQIDGDVQAELEQADEKASALLCQIFSTLREPEKPSKRLRQFPRVWREFHWGTGVAEWVERNALLRWLIALFDLRPDTIPLPRTLCLLHYKGAQFQTRSSISDWEFERSLRWAGFSSDEVVRLREWLSHPANKEAIEKMECKEFLEFLKEKGVRAESGKRSSEQWIGII